MNRRNIRDNYPLCGTPEVAEITEDAILYIIKLQVVVYDDFDPFNSAEIFQYLDLSVFKNGKK